MKAPLPQLAWTVLAEQRADPEDRQNLLSLALQHGRDELIPLFRATFRDTLLDRSWARTAKDGLRGLRQLLELRADPNMQIRVRCRKAFGFGRSCGDGGEERTEG